MDAAYKKTCRACLLESGADVMFPLNDGNLRQIYFECTTIEIPPDDAGPKLLCNTCRNKMMRWEKFRSDALESERKLKMPLVVTTHKMIKNSGRRSEPVQVKMEKGTEFSAPVEAPKKQILPVASSAMVEINPSLLQVKEEKGATPDMSFQDDQEDFSEEDNDPSTSQAEVKDEEESEEEYNEMVEIIDMNYINVDTGVGKVRRIPVLPMKQRQRKLPEPVLRPKRDTPSVYRKSDGHQNNNESSADDSNNQPPPRKYAKYDADEFVTIPPPKDRAPKKEKKVTEMAELQVMRINTDIPLLCPLCNGAFTTYNIFKKHFDDEHENDVLPGRTMDKMCLSCGIKMLPGETLLKHTVQNHMEMQLRVASRRPPPEVNTDNVIGRPPKGYVQEPLSCETCGITFKLRHALEMHKRKHEFGWHCKHCSKGFLHEQELKEHQKEHDVQRLQCNVCEKKFSHAASLKDHALVHTGERPFSCPICKKRFSIKSNARRHMLVHNTFKLGGTQALNVVKVPNTSVQKEVTAAVQKVPIQVAQKVPIQAVQKVTTSSSAVVERKPLMSTVERTMTPPTMKVLNSFNFKPTEVVPRLVVMSPPVIRISQEELQK